MFHVVWTESVKILSNEMVRDYTQLCFSCKVLQGSVLCPIYLLLTLPALLTLPCLFWIVILYVGYELHMSLYRFWHSLEKFQAILVLSPQWLPYRLIFPLLTFVGPPCYGGSYKITVVCLPVYPCVCLSVRQLRVFLRNGSIVFSYFRHDGR